MSGRPCSICGVPLPVRDGRSWRRRYCSQRCTNAARRARFSPQLCACGCGENPKNKEAKYVAGHKPTRPLDERLWSRVTKLRSGCWEWQGFRGAHGYGQIGRGGRNAGIVATHRAAWEVAHGPIPEGLSVCHRCDNPPCCNPDHLFLGTPADNVADAATKGRIARGERLPQAKLTRDEVREIRQLRKQGLKQIEIASKFGISQGYASELLSGRYRKVT